HYHAGASTGDDPNRARCRNRAERSSGSKPGSCNAAIRRLTARPDHISRRNSSDGGRFSDCLLGARVASSKSGSIDHIEGGVKRTTKTQRTQRRDKKSLCPLCLCGSLFLNKACF